MRLKHLVASGALFLFPFFAQAQQLEGTQAISNFKGSLTAAAGAGGLLNSSSPAAIVGNFINAILAVAGLVLVCLMVYAGVLYMQGGQDEKKIAQAKGIIMHSVIGIVLILAAFAISSFVITALAGVTGPGAAPTP
jgi:lysylphosphatidylglycerol synthetase-like protein (DUF2156 family)